VRALDQRPQRLAQLLDVAGRQAPQTRDRELRIVRGHRLRLGYQPDEPAPSRPLEPLRRLSRQQRQVVEGVEQTEPVELPALPASTCITLRTSSARRNRE
jgi:hypothetical protein